jgi:hypothetical protein
MLDFRGRGVEGHHGGNFGVDESDEAVSWREASGRRFEVEGYDGDYGAFGGIMAADYDFRVGGIKVILL